MNKQELVNKVLGFTPQKKKYNDLQTVKEYAPANFAVIKYWGKQNGELNIPVADSISISLGDGYGTTTQISQSEEDIFILNGENINNSAKEFKKTFDFINLFRNKDLKLKIKSKNDLYTASGLATSASGFAALALALNSFFKWNLSEEKLSILARIGSGSASRSIYKNALVRLSTKEKEYAYSYKLDYKLDSLYLGLLTFDNVEKKTSSRDGMNVTTSTSILYQNGWKKQVEHDIEQLEIAFKNNDWQLFQTTVQLNALAMHATIISSGIIYWNAQTLENINKILELQQQGVHICFTEDAGPHLKILSDKKETIEKYFPGIDILKIF